MTAPAEDAATKLYPDPVTGEQISKSERTNPAAYTNIRRPRR